MSKDYPYMAWALMPSFRPVEVRIVGSSLGEWEKSDTGKLYNHGDLHDSLEAAITFGWDQVRKQEEDLEKRHKRLAKRRLALHKAAKDAPHWLASGDLVEVDEEVQ
jgi:hypothetical protein